MTSYIKKIVENKYFAPILLIICLLPTILRMLRPGIFSMQDFHIFRLFEFDKCIVDLQIPCRWSPDVANGYGQPLFNFYGPLVYVFGEIFHFVGFSFINSIKILFSLSLLLSGLSMYLLGTDLWKNRLSAFICALIYVYAPYRALDVFVRGALPEAFSFVIFPLIVYFFNKTIETKQKKYLLSFAASYAVLLLNHNLSAFMFLFFLVPWAIYKIILHRAFTLIPRLFLAAVITVGLSSFYLLPVIFEAKFVSLQRTITGFYSYFNHFASINQLFISRFWGYGGSPDFISLSVGHIQWILPLVILLFIVLKSKPKKYLSFFVLLIIGWFLLFLTHNQSTFIWKNFIQLQYVQFPWRFIGLAVFSFALSAGCLPLLIKNKTVNLGITSVLLILLVVLNAGFFKEDLWFNYTDQDLFSGTNMAQQMASSRGDYWPIYGPDLPDNLAPVDPNIVSGIAQAKLIKKNSFTASYSINVATTSATIQFPIVYFPGWQGTQNGQTLTLYPSGRYGEITAILNEGSSEVSLIFTDTPIRRLGNVLSLITVFLLPFIWISKPQKHD